MTPNPLATLIELAQTQTDDAVRRLGELQRAQLGAHEQLALLEQYRQDYLVQLQARMAQGLSMERLRNFQGFLVLLDDAIAQQQRAADQAGERLADGRTQWQTSHRRLQAFGTLSSRVERRAQVVQQKKEQRDTDERAARARPSLGPNLHSTNAP